MQKNDFVKVNYEAKIKESGQLVDKAEKVMIIVGAGYLIKGLDEALEEIDIGQKKEGEIIPDKAFGPRNPDFIKLVPLSEFKKHGQNPVPGMVISGDNMRGRVLSVASGRVRVDFNHPLAGKILLYNIEIIEKVEKLEDKINGIVKFYSRDETNTNPKINEKEIELTIPPTIHPVYKKKISDDIIKFCGFEKVKFSEIFEKPKEA